MIGILKEYLSALIEFSPLKDTFAAWTEKLGKEPEPPAAAGLVVPDPARLDAAAVAQARQEVANSPVSDPAKLKSLLDEGGVAGAVAVANQTRYLQEHASRPLRRLRPARLRQRQQQRRSPRRARRPGPLTQHF